MLANAEVIRLVREHKLFIVLLFAVAAVLLLMHFSLPVIDRDEARYAQASRQMVESGDWIVVRFQDDLRAKKPAGIYWLQSISGSVFGKNSIASFRLPSLLALMAVLMAIYYFAPRFNIIGKGGALMANALTASALIAFAEGMMAKTDSVLLLTSVAMQLALWQVYSSRKLGNAGGAVYLFWAAMGIGIMVKGPITPGLALATIACLCLLDRKIDWLLKLKPLTGVLIASTIALPWYVMVWHATDGEFIRDAFFNDFAAKLQSGQESHGFPPGYFTLLAIFLIFPSSLFLSRVKIRPGDLASSDAARFLCCWIVGFLILIELTPTKLPHYILPIIPSIALLVTLKSDDTFAGLPGGMLSLSWLIACGCVSALFLVGIFMLISQYGDVENTTTMLALGTFIGALGLAWYFFLTGAGAHNSPRMLGFAASALVMHASLFGGIFGSLNALHLSPKIAELTNRVTTQCHHNLTRLAIEGYNEPSLVFALSSGNPNRVTLVDIEKMAQLLTSGDIPLGWVSHSKLPALIKSLDDTGFVMTTHARIKGINYSNGKSIDLALIGRSCPSAS